MTAQTALTWKATAFLGPKVGVMKPRWMAHTLAILFGKDYAIQINDRVPALTVWLVEAL